MRPRQPSSRPPQPSSSRLPPRRRFTRGRRRLTQERVTARPSHQYSSAIPPRARVRGAAPPLYNASPGRRKQSGSILAPVGAVLPSPPSGVVHRHFPDSQRHARAAAGVPKLQLKSIQTTARKASRRTLERRRQGAAVMQVDSARPPAYKPEPSARGPLTTRQPVAGNRQKRFVDPLADSITAFGSKTDLPGAVVPPVLRANENVDANDSKHSEIEVEVVTRDTDTSRSEFPVLKRTGSTTSMASMEAMTPATVMRLYRDRLTAFEQSELLEYPEIYFVGRADAAKVKGMPHGAQNNGYDDERGDYHVVEGDHVAYRFEILGVVGKGSFGKVVKVKDHKTGATLALKVIRNKKRFQKQATVEVKLLEHIKTRDPLASSHIIHVQHHFAFRNHLCITFELLGQNLYELLKSNGLRGCKLGVVREYARQIVQSLAFLAKEGIVHCDLKPENILVARHSEAVIKLIDFGSSCFKNQTVFTYIQSRFYRAPEIILGLSYGLPIDMWSLGCILAELFTGRPIFPGENEAEQIQCMMEVLGTPPKRILAGASRANKYFDTGFRPYVTPNSRGRVRRAGSKTLSRALHTNDTAFLSFLDSCFHWEPCARMTPAQALQHPFLTGSASQPRPPPRRSSQGSFRSPRRRRSRRVRETSESSSHHKQLPPMSTQRTPRQLHHF